VSDKDLIGTVFKYVGGHLFEVTDVHPKIPGAILYRDHNNGLKAQCSRYTCDGPSSASIRKA
jgi:hypothetical protein